MAALGSILILGGLFVLVLGLIRPRLFHWLGMTPGRWVLVVASIVMMAAGVVVIPTPPSQETTVAGEVASSHAATVEEFDNVDLYCRFAQEDTEITERAVREIGPNAAYGIAAGETITLEQPVVLKPTPRPGVEDPEVAATWKRESYQLPSGSQVEVMDRNQEGGETHYLVRTGDGVLGFVDPVALLWLDQGERTRLHSEALAAFRDPLKEDLRNRFKQETGLDFLEVELVKGMTAGWNVKCEDR